MISYTSYRDGGTMSIKAPFIKIICNSETDEICVDDRIDAGETRGKVTLGYPGEKDTRELSNEERAQILPLIKERIQADIKWRQAYLEKLESYNL